MMYYVKSLPTSEQFQGLLDGAARVDPEWVTVVKFAYQAGIKSSTGRHLRPDDLVNEWMTLKPQLSGCTLRRRLPEDVLQHLRSLAPGGAVRASWISRMARCERWSPEDLTWSLRSMMCVTMCRIG